MGFGPAARELHDMLGLTPPRSICDLGSQDVSYVEPDGTVVNRESAREWFEGRGFEYDCIDIDGRHGARRLNLNVATAADVGRCYGVVANHGTSEHVFDQANVFRLMHDLTAPHGIMVHAVPTPRFGTGHGFYFYDETLFEDLARANGYRIVQMHRRSEPHEIIIVALMKRFDAPFAMPFQAMYDPTLREAS